MDDKIAYDSIENLPSIIELRKTIEGFKHLASIFGLSDAAKECNEAKIELDRIVKTVDSFYFILGNRNWVFSDALSLVRIQDVVAQNTPEEAEKVLISYLQEKGVIFSMLNRLNRFADMRSRLPLLRKAADDFTSGRYYGSILVTVSMMDGFVCDAFKENRKGLHARKPEEMYVEDCVAAAWNGLPSVQASYTKGVKSRIEENVFDVHRHGIMHGMEVNYDNVYVAAKAWCMLFAVCDWVEAKQKLHEESTEIESKTLEQFLSEIKTRQVALKEQSKLLDEWRAHEIDLKNPYKDDKGVLEAVIFFFEMWQSKNYGKLCRLFPNYTNDSEGKMAGEARSLYSGCLLGSYEIKSIKRVAPSVAEVQARLENASQTWCVSLRFVKMNGSSPVADWETGDWKLMLYGTSPFEDSLNR